MNAFSWLGGGGQVGSGGAQALPSWLAGLTPNDSPIAPGGNYWPPEAYAGGNPRGYPTYTGPVGGPGATGGWTEPDVLPGNEIPEFSPIGSQFNPDPSLTIYGGGPQSSGGGSPPSYYDDTVAATQYPPLSGVSDPGWMQNARSGGSSTGSYYDLPPEIAAALGLTTGGNTPNGSDAPWGPQGQMWMSHANQSLAGPSVAAVPWNEEMPLSRQLSRLGGGAYGGGGGYGGMMAGFKMR
jgi:hypothetical protein